MNEIEILKLLAQALKEDKGVFLKTDGTATLIEPQNGKRFSFKELYPLIECSTIEQVEIHSGLVMLLDEEGKFGSSPVKNENATVEYQRGRMTSKEYLAQLKEQYGDNVIVMDDPLGEEERNNVYGNVVIVPRRMV